MKYILLLSLFFVSSFSLAEETIDTEIAVEQMDAQAQFELGLKYRSYFYENFQQSYSSSNESN